MIAVDLARKTLLETPAHDKRCRKSGMRVDPNCSRCRYLSLYVRILSSLPRG